MCIFTVIDAQKTSQRVKDDSHATRLHLMSYFLFLIRCDVILTYITVQRHEEM